MVTKGHMSRCGQLICFSTMFGRYRCNELYEGNTSTLFTYTCLYRQMPNHFVKQWGSLVFSKWNTAFARDYFQSDIWCTSEYIQLPLQQIKTLQEANVGLSQNKLHCMCVQRNNESCHSVQSCGLLMFLTVWTTMELNGTKENISGYHQTCNFNHNKDGKWA